MSDTIKAKPGQYLTFALNNQTFGMPIEAVREINRVPNLTPVPQAPDFVAGVMNLREKVIPVVDFRTCLNLPKVSATKQTCVIVAERAEGLFGIIVDSVKSVMDFTENQIEPSPHMGSNAQGLHYIIGMGKTEEEVVVLVDVQKALSADFSGLQFPGPSPSAAAAA